MAEDDRTFRTSTPAANRAEQQGLGVGQRELEAAREPSGEQHAIDPQRLEPFDDGEASTEDRAFADDGERLGDLGEGTPPNVDVHKLGQEDKPEEDWGEYIDEPVVHSANHTRRPIKTEAERGQGAKTRQLNKDIVSRRR